MEPKQELKHLKNEISKIYKRNKKSRTRQKMGNKYHQKNIYMHLNLYNSINIFLLS